MDVNSDFEGEVRARLDRLEQTVAELGSRPSAQPHFTAQPERHPQPRPHVAPSMKPRAAAASSHGADWWLARAGAALTVLALILLYQYAVGHGWITPVVRVLTGTAVGAALMYWGRRLEPAGIDAPAPVALRELMMGSGLAVWYASAYAASVSYHLISIPTARFIYLAVSIVGGLIALNERRSLVAIIAIGTGFATPALLSSPTGSVPGYTLFLGVLGALSVYLYLMRGWQSILWLAAFSMAGSIEAATSMIWRSGVGNGLVKTHFGSAPISVTILILVMTYAFVRAPALRRKLVATGADRYAEPIRSSAAQDFLKNIGRFFKLMSPNAGAADSLSLWVITLFAPLVGIALFTQTWNLGSYPGSALAIIGAGFALKIFLSNTESDLELKDLYCAAAVLWSLAGVIATGRSLGYSAGIGQATVPFAAVALYSMALVTFLSLPRFLPAVGLGRLLAGSSIVLVAFLEFAALGGPNNAFVSSVFFSIAEILTIVAAFAAAREVSKHGGQREAVVVLAIAGYVAFLLVDGRVLGSIWPPLVTATFAIAGTALLLRSRGQTDKLVRWVGGATIALVIGRLLFVDLVGVDTIWRVLLFLGCGALFLFTSHQIQNASRQTPPDPA